MQAPITAPARRAEARPDRRWWTLAVLCLSLLAITVDGTIVNTALPTLARDLDASSAQLQWIVDAYPLVFAGLLLTAGALGDRRGRHRMLAGGLALFGVSSLAAAFTTTAGALIAARAVMGIGGAMIMPATLSIISDVFSDPRERTRAIGLWTAAAGLGVAIGPTLGGLLLEHFAWGSVFLINVPIVVVALVAGARLVPPSRAAEPTPLDLRGAALSTAGLALLTYGLITAPEHGWLSAMTVGIVALAVGVLGVFVAVERRAEHPMVDLALFRDARFSAAASAVTIVSFSLFGSLFLLTQILQLVRGYSTLAAGAGALPFAVTVGAVSPLAAALSARVGARPPVTAGLVVLAAGLGIMATATAETGYWFFVGATVVMAVGMGLAIAPGTDAIMSALPVDRAGVGSAINDTTRQLGAVLGVAIIGSITTSSYAAAMSGTAGPAGQSIGGAVTTAAAMRGDGAHLLDRARDAFMTGASHGLLAAAGVALAGALIAWLWLPARAPHRATAGRGAPARPVSTST